MNNGKNYWDLKIEETKELFKRRPNWMGAYDNDFPSAAFIKGIISEFRPETLLEAGTAAGWAAYYMLEEAHKYSKTATLTSIDIAEYIYHSSERKIGAAFAQMSSELMKFWDLHTKTTLVDYAQNCSRKFDFVFIDADHFHPHAVFDLLAAMPILSDNAVIIFHDVFLNKIVKGEMPADRHPYPVVDKNEKFWGPNSIYEAFKEKMMLSYDEIAPNCAAMMKKEITFDGILVALNKNWEKEIWQNVSSKDLMHTVLKIEKLVKNTFGEGNAVEFIKICQKRMKEDGQNAENFYNKQYSARSDYLNKLLNNKKTVLWGASRFLCRLIEENKLEKANVLGIVDINPSLQGKVFGGVTVYSPEMLTELKPQQICSTVVTTPEMKAKIENILEHKGIYGDFEIIDDLFERFQNLEN